MQLILSENKSIAAAWSPSIKFEYFIGNSSALIVNVFLKHRPTAHVWISKDIKLIEVLLFETALST